MNAKKLSILKITLLAVLLVLVAQFASAAWNDPTATPPGNNTETPVNVGAAPQVKQGGLSVDAFTAYMNSIFKQAVTVEQLMAPTPEPRGVCTDQTGKLIPCNQYKYSAFDEIVAFSAHYNGGNSWTIEKTLVMFTSDPTHLNRQVQIDYTEKPGTGHYRIRAYWDLGSNGRYYIDSDEILSATLVNDNNTQVKLNMVDWDGNNTIEFKTADDASTNDLVAGDEVKFMFTLPTVN